MLAPLLLQAAALFPASEVLVEADPAYTARVLALAAESSWSDGEVEALRAELGSREAEASLAQLLDEGDDSELRLAALVASGTRTPWLADALYATGCSYRGEAAALACLLAPADVPERWWPALLMRAQDPLATLPVRAGAMARLLDGGCLEVWPFVRSVLRTGTAVDEPAPWADWKRTGRYELPKRILTLSLDRLLKDFDGQPSGFEPNAAWDAQVAQLAAMEPRLWQDGRPRAELVAGREVTLTLAGELARRHDAGDAAAGRALAILLSVHPAPLVEAYGGLRPPR
jgi:hypothetical protein